MKKKIKIIFVVFLVLLCMLTAGTYYLNTYYLPQTLKIKLEQTLSEKLNADVALQDIRFHFLKGVVIENFRIALEKGALPLLRIKQLSASVLLLPSFKEKKIIIPSLHIDSAQLSIVRAKDATINLSQLIPKETTDAKTPLTFPFLIYKISLTNSTITFIDNALDASLQQTLTIQTLTAQPGPASINAQLQATLLNEEQATPLEATARYEYATKQIDATINIKRLNLVPYLSYAKELPVTIKSLNTDAIVFNGAYSLLKKRLTLDVNATITNTYCVKDDLLISNARTKLEAKTVFDLQEKKMVHYEATLRDLSTQVQMPALLEPVSIDKAQLILSPDVLTVESAHITMHGIALTSKGKLQHFTAPTFSFQLSSDFLLPQAQKIATRYVKGIEAIALEGNASLSAEIQKRADKNTIDYRGSLRLTNASLMREDFTAHEINGTILFSPDTVSWENLSLRIFERTYSSTATISNFSSPTITLSASSEDITLNTRVATIEKNVFAIEKLSLTFLHSACNANGEFSLKDPDNPFVSLTLDSLIALENLKAISAIPKETLSSINPSGVCKLSGTIKGNPKKPLSLTSSLSLNSNEVKLSEFRLNDITMQLVLEDGQCKIPQSTATFYNGSVVLNGLIDLNKENMPYAFKLIAENIDLSRLKENTPLKEQEFSGMLSMAVVVNGEPQSPATIQGQGNLLIANGYLWAFNPLNKLKDFLFIPRRQILIFKEAQGNFVIKDSRAFTDSLVLHSDEITLVCEGSIGFDKTIDFEITPIPAQETTENIPAQELFNDTFVKVAGIAAVTLTGTIEQPQIGTKLLTKDVVKAIAEGIGKNTGKIAEGLFETFKDFGAAIFGTPK